MIRIFTLFMTVWGLGGFFFVIIAVSDLLFSRNWKAFLNRVAMIGVWPIALATKRGRDNLFSVFQQTQG